MPDQRDDRDSDRPGDRPGDGGSHSIEERLDRLESYEAIRQLASRYAAALDRRDVVAMAELFIPDVKTADGGVGRAALAAWLDPILRPYTTTFHLIGNHVIDFVDADHATGIVYCRPEHEVGDEWIVMPMQYWDRYQRVDGVWCFTSRTPKVFYATDILEHPLRVADRFHFPGNPMITKAELPGRWESWQLFWSERKPPSTGDDTDT